MKWLVLGVLVCLARSGEGGVQAPKLKQGRSCEPGTSWRSQCNDCGCTADGVPFCTDKACPGQESEPERMCAPESSWKLQCNTCSCTPNGKAMCTKIGCLDIASLPALESPQIDQTPESDAERGYDDHLQDGLADSILDHSNEDIGLDNLVEAVEDSHNLSRDHFFITNQNLIDPERSLEDSDLDLEDGDDNHIHEPNDLTHKSHVVIKRSQVCKPSQVFQSECNSCNCASDGQSYTCSHNECMEGDTNKEVEVFMENEGEDHVERHSVCKPRGTFYIGCNTCHCNLYGTDYSCTNKPCPLPEDVELFHELKAVKSSKNETQKIVCLAMRMFIKDCNTCWCNEDGTSFYCTRRACLSELPEDGSKEKKEAVKSSRNETQKIVCVAMRMFIKDCNTCWCNEDGTSFFCTRKVCSSELPEEGSEEKKEQSLRIIRRECRPNEVFELECNMCRCNPDGKSYSCTRRACLEQIEEVSQTTSVSRRKRGVTQETPKTCQPGQEFRMDCNKCLCDNEGQDFSCTRIDCDALNNNNGGARTKRDTSEQITIECRAGSVFDRDCNVCRCTEDGHHATCTTKRCSVPKSQDNDVNSPVSASDPNFRCNPGEQFKRECNDCSCSADGKSIFCTVRLCDQDITPPPSH